LKMTFSFSEEAAKNLPEVSNEDLETGNEKYRILLGNIGKQNNEWINAEIKGVLEADLNEKDLFYKEKKEEVSPNLDNIKKWVKSIQDSAPEYKDFNFIGDIHTHPITRENNLDKNVSPCTPSDKDIEDVIQQYENGNLSLDEPFIFGIAGRRSLEEDTSYAFYRLIKKDGKYVTEQVDKK
jgi:hypothetical protein